MITKAIIIKKQNTNEYDQWVTCYTEEFGKLRAVAKSILKPSSIQALHLDIFNLVEFDLINGRGMPIITGAQVINALSGIKNSLAKTAVAYFFAEVIDKMVFENEKDKELWSFITSFLNELNDGKTDPMFLLRQGQKELLNIMGYFPEINSCKSCNCSLNVSTFCAFNHNLGGVICKECFLSGYGGILMSNEDYLMLATSKTDGKDKLLLFSSVGQAVGLLKNKINYGGEKKAVTYLGLTKRSVLDGMFEYIYGGEFSSLELLNMIK